MSWVGALSLLCILGFLACVLIVAYCEIKDRRNRGMRISNGEINRERITPSIPFDFKDRFL